MTNARAAQRLSRQNARQGGLLMRVLIGSFLVVLVTIVIMIVFTQNAEMTRLAEKRAALEAERDRLSVIDADLRHLQSIMDTDAYWEHVARNQLGMARPHEFIIRLDD